MLLYIGFANLFWLTLTMSAKFVIFKFLIFQLENVLIISNLWFWCVARKYLLILYGWIYGTGLLVYTKYLINDLNWIAIHLIEFWMENDLDWTIVLLNDR